ncbi:LPXTG cell wall anchor domain-containing protein [Streptomyces sp. NPDC059396]|uniref:LPXTG cell wall anchor domain-containing protein n=1 Tax=Streptomyces sp. NPDC059396 TaxID=3346819 RepID=UPI0036AECCE7
MSGETSRFNVGGGWHGLTAKLENVSDTALRDITVKVEKHAYDVVPDFPANLQEYVTIQRWDTQSRTWAEIPWDTDETEGPLPPIDIAPRKTVTLQLRMRVEKDFPYGSWSELETRPIGTGYLDLQVFGPDGEGICKYGDVWFYNIFKPGTETGDGGGSEPPSSSEPTPQTGGTASADPAPTPTAPTTPAASTGDLAHTGSSSALPLLGLTGGAAVALGAGAVYVVRRRRTGTNAT